MTAADITSMIEKENFPESFNSFQKNKIMSLWHLGKVRDAQQLVQDLIDNPVNPNKTLL